MNYRNISELTLKGNFIKKVGYKPYLSNLISLLATVLLVATMNKLAIILGTFLLTLNMASFVFIKDYPTMAIYDDGVLIYNVKNTNQGYFLPFENIIRWTAKKDSNKVDCIYFQLENAEIYVPTFQSGKALRTLNKYIEKKEINYLEGKTIGRLFDFQNNSKKK
ncbi:MAG: hypothetical protein Q4C64_01125 [Erysipelotrichia bacterium]|nr:hypothetical protein [Erysipelotrichia bacterium]